MRKLLWLAQDGAKKYLGVRTTKYEQNLQYQQRRYWVYAWVQLAESLVEILSLGYLTADWTNVVLFSDWLTGEERKEK